MKRKFGITMILAGMAISLSSCLAKDPTSGAKACYRLTEKGAALANAAVVEKQNQKKLFKAWGIYPKGIDDSSSSSDDVVSYSAGDVINTTSALSLSINKSDADASVNAMDDLFLIGTHNGGILNRKNANDSVDEISAILYPSTTAVTGELSTYDLTANWVGGEKTVSESVYNSAQACAVNYKLVNNTGELSTNTYETNLHFAVTMRNDGGIVTDSYESSIDWNYENISSESYESFKTIVSSMFASYNSEAVVWTSIYVADGSEIDYDSFKTAIENAIADKSMSVSLKLKATDSDGNSTDMMGLTVNLIDNVNPYAVDVSGNALESVELNIGEIDRCSESVFVAGIEKKLTELGISFKDEIDGTVYPKIDVRKGKLLFTVTDNSGNTVEYTDSTTTVANQGASSSIKCDNLSANIDYYETGAVAFSIRGAKTSASVWSCDTSDLVVNKGTDFEDSVVVDTITKVDIGGSLVTANLILDSKAETLKVGREGIAFAKYSRINLYISKNVILSETAVVCSMNASSELYVYFECSDTEYAENISSSKYHLSWCEENNNTVHKLFGVTKDSFKTAVDF